MTIDTHAEPYRKSRSDHWDAVARKMEFWTGWGKAYHKRLAQIYGFWAAPGQRVLEVGCGSGDLLAALRPSVGVGVDFSAEMVRRARTLHPDIEFVEADGHDLSFLKGPFDVIILSDLIDDLWDVQEVFEQLKTCSHARTRLIINSYSRLWELPLRIAAKAPSDPELAHRCRHSRTPLPFRIRSHQLLAGDPLAAGYAPMGRFMQQDPREGLAVQASCLDQLYYGEVLSGENSRSSACVRHRSRPQ
jgi:SAM-dependent methyltransferase